MKVFFAYRLRVLSRFCLPLIGWIGAFLRCASGIALSVIISGNMSDIVTHYWWLMTIHFALSVVVDGLNTLSVCVYLLRRRSDLKS